MGILKLNRPEGENYFTAVELTNQSVGSAKGELTCTLGSMYQAVSAITTGCCRGNVNAVLEWKGANGHACVPIKLCLHKHGRQGCYGRIILDTVQMMCLCQGAF